MDYKDIERSYVEAAARVTNPFNGLGMDRNQYNKDIDAAVKVGDAGSATVSSTQPKPQQYNCE